jgi:dTDP-4-amino-4,6-dideoxygalactose transaminase
MLNVTKAFLPDKSEYTQYLDGIWERAWLTNHGPLVCKLEEELKEFLGVKHLFFVNNGTIAIQIALKALEVIGEVITTPFSYVATTSSLVWEGHKPVFADIDPETLCLCPKAVRKLINEKTTAILATHVFGTPCDVHELDLISKEFNIPVIYDAAHAFGVKVGDTSVLNYGDISTLSFHATKVFHTVEGGAIVTDNDALAHKISYMRNFGHDGPERFFGVGINGKCSEFHAAMGLAVLKHIPNLIEQRRTLAFVYNVELEELLNGKDAFLKQPRLHDPELSNFGYYPVLFKNEEALLNSVAALKKRDVMPRRYFYPSLSALPYVNNPNPTPIADNISKRILCLPFYPGMTRDDIRLVRDTLLESFSEGRVLKVGNS